MGKMTMGNDEFILYIRLKPFKCTLSSKELARLIRQWLKRNGLKDEDILEDIECHWGKSAKNVDPKDLPKTATQFEIEIDLLPKLYKFLDELALKHAE